METALILGATKGLGQEIAKLCQERNWKTIEVGSSAENRTEGTRAYRHCDLTNAASVHNFIQYIKSEQIDHYFWVAGRIIKGNLHEQTTSDIEKTIDVNFRNSMLISHAVWQQMHNATTPKTYIIIASSSGVTPREDEAIYAATKHALVGYGRSLGLENKNRNVSVHLFLPSGMKTPFWDRNPSPAYDTFLDPAKVAAKIMETIDEHKSGFAETSIPRGSL